MLHLPKPARRGAARVAALLLVTAFLWCWQHRRLDWESWSRPLDYTGDSLVILARFKAVAEGGLIPFAPHILHRLDAPFRADWSEYPASDDIATFAFGLVARATGVFAAGNVAMLLVHLTAAASFYFCARRLRHRWEWAFAGALLFAFSFFSLMRGLPHLWVAFTWTVPLALFTCAVIASGRRMVARPAVRWLCGGVAVVMGATNPYNLFLYLQLLAGAVLAAWRLPRRSANVRLGLACGGLAVMTVVAINASARIHVVDEGGQPLLVRNYAGTEIYGLKPIELFVPPAVHHLGLFAALGHRYVRGTDWRGETFSPYLGIVGGAALLGLLAAAGWSLLARRGCRPPGRALPALWVLLFSAIGGINCILAFFFGLDVFRGSNRYSIFLLALALMFLVSQMTRLTRRWPSGLRLGVAGLLAALGLWDQLPAREPPAVGQAVADIVDADRRLGGRLEAQLGPGAMVFQLPVLDFPEGLPRFQLNMYEHIRPYLATRTLRFSFGGFKNRARNAWQYDCERLPAPALVAELENAGFSALYVNRRGYPDNAAKLLADLAAAGRGEVLDGSTPDQVVVRLAPAVRPQPPLAQEMTFGRGWNRRQAGEPDSEPRWTNGSASLSYCNPFSRPLPVSLRLSLGSAGERSVRFLLNGREQARVRLGGAAREVTLPALLLRPGANRFDLDTPEPAIRVSDERLRLRAIALHRIELQVASQPEMEPGAGGPDSAPAQTPHPPGDGKGP